MMQLEQTRSMWGGFHFVRLERLVLSSALTAKIDEPAAPGETGEPEPAMFPALREARRIARQAVRDFVEGAACGDIARMVSTFHKLDYGDVDGGGWKRAMRAAAKLPSMPDATREFFLNAYVQYGDHIRGECDDLALVSGLRMLLPRYDGPALRLYRGEAFMVLEAPGADGRDNLRSRVTEQSLWRGRVHRGPSATYIGAGHCSLPRVDPRGAQRSAVKLRRRMRRDRPSGRFLFMRTRAARCIRSARYLG